VDGQPGGLVSSDKMLSEIVPAILASPAFEKDGLLVVTFDEAEGTDAASSTACCGEQPGPNSPSPGIGGPGGGRVGAIVISPFTEPGSANDTPYNHYALLRSMEDLFGLEHLGFAAAPGLKPFGDDVFGRAAASGMTTTSTTVAPVSSTTADPAGDGLAVTGGGPSAPWVFVLVVGAGLSALVVVRRIAGAHRA
jgi:hypothetical protein